jgi:hypothetical protein
MQIKNIAYILHCVTVVISKKFKHRLRILLISYRMGSKLYQERIDVCNQELILVETYTSFYHNNTWIITVSTNFIYMCVCV